MILYANATNATRNISTLNAFSYKGKVILLYIIIILIYYYNNILI